MSLTFEKYVIQHFQEGKNKFKGNDNIFIISNYNCEFCEMDNSEKIILDFSECINCDFLMDYVPYNSVIVGLSNNCRLISGKLHDKVSFKYSDMSLVIRHSDQMEWPTNWKLNNCTNIDLITDSYKIKLRGKIYSLPEIKTSKLDIKGSYESIENQYVKTLLIRKNERLSIKNINCKSLFSISLINVGNLELCNFAIFDTLTEIMISSCNLNTGIFNLSSSIKKLTLSNSTGLEQITLNNTKNLESLIIYNCETEHLEVESAESLMRLDLNNNNLERLPILKGLQFMSIVEYLRQSLAMSTTEVVYTLKDFLEIGIEYVCRANISALDNPLKYPNGKMFDHSQNINIYLYEFERQVKNLTTKSATSC